MVVPGVLLAALVWLGGRPVLDGSLTRGGLVAAFGYASFLVTPLSTFGELGRKWARALAGAGRIASLLRTPPDVARPVVGEPPAGPGRVESQGLTVRVDGHAVIDRADLVIRAGRHVGIVADDPAAVGLLTEVLGAHRDPDGGTILSDGVDVPSLPPAVQRRHLLVAEHHAHLFGGTQRDNLDPAADDGRLLRALRDAAAAASRS